MQEQQPGMISIQQLRQTLEALRGSLARISFAHHAPMNQRLEHCGIALFGARSGTVGQTVAERQDHVVRL